MGDSVQVLGSYNYSSNHKWNNRTLNSLLYEFKYKLKGNLLYYILTVRFEGKILRSCPPHFPSYGALCRIQPIGINALTGSLYEGKLQLCSITKIINL